MSQVKRRGVLIRPGSVRKKEERVNDNTEKDPRRSTSTISQDQVAEANNEVSPVASVTFASPRDVYNEIRETSS